MRAVTVVRPRCASRLRLAKPFSRSSTSSASLPVGPRMIMIALITAASCAPVDNSSLTVAGGMCGNSKWACPSEHRLRHLELGAQGTEIMGQTVKLMLRLRGCLRDRLVDYLLGLVQDPLRLRLLIQPLDLRVEPAEHLHERLLFAGLGLVKRLQDNSMAVHLSLLRLEEIFDFIDPRDQCFLEVADEARHGGRHLLFELKGEALRVAIGLVDLPSQVAFEIARLSFKRLHSRIQRGDGR